MIILRTACIFVTICVTEKYQVLWENVGANSVRPLTANEILHPKLSVTGKLVKRKTHRDI